MTTDSIQIAKENGTEYRSVRLSIDDGGLRIQSHDMGPDVERFWRSDDYEYWVKIKPENFTTLLKALLTEKYHGNFDAVEDFHDFCKANEIPCEWDSWT